MYQRRLIVCMLGGVIASLLCITGRQVIFDFPEIAWDTFAYTMANRLLLGFVIGISSWKINHLAHGALLGLIVSLPVSIGFLPEKSLGFLIYTGAGIVYGIGIEWLSTNIFKAPMRTT